MKKLFTIMIVVMCMFSMTACSSSGNSNNNNNQANDVQAIKIGGSGPTSGDYAEYGNAVKNAAQLAVDEINALGGVQFELNFQDDQGDPDQAETAFGTLMDWGMQLSLSTTTSGAGIRVSPLYEENHIFAMTPSGSNPLLTLKGDGNNENDYYGNIFQMCFTDPNQGIASADYISMNNLGSSIAIIYENDIDYSVSVYNKFMEQAKNLGLNVVYEGTFVDADTDFSVQLTAAQQAGADLVFLPIYYKHATYILNQANTMNYAPIFFGVDGMDGILGQDGFDSSIAEGVYLLTPFSATSPDSNVQHFVSEYQSKFGSTPNQFAADAYDVVYAMYECVKAGNITADMSAQDICDAMLDQILSLTFTGVTGESKWQANGQVTKVPMAVVIHDGAYTDPQ